MTYIDLQDAIWHLAYGTFVPKITEQRMREEGEILAAKSDDERQKSQDDCLRNIDLGKARLADAHCAGRLSLIGRKASLDSEVVGEPQRIPDEFFALDTLAVGNDLYPAEQLHARDGVRIVWRCVKVRRAQFEALIFSSSQPATPKRGGSKAEAVRHAIAKVYPGKVPPRHKKANWEICNELGAELTRMGWVGKKAISEDTILREAGRRK
ncbi:MAG TPA: hypothetical protein VHW69_14745 [Rhizomicrobium sp.]|nr:hypothetical protein [Rhizomicrobium sp.]